MRRSEALMTLGTIAARNGDLDEAIGYGMAALGDPRKCLPSLLTAAHDLNVELREHPGERAVARWAAAIAEIRAPTTRSTAQLNPH